MNSNMHFVTRNLHLMVAVLLGIAATGAYAATDTPPTAEAATPAAVAKPEEPLEQLKQIWVRGKHLATAVADAEDDFFYLYNRLNKNSDYDITCGTMSLNRGSMIMVRICMPGFLADSLIAARAGASATYMPGFTSGSSGPCFASGGMTVQGDMNGGMYYTSSYCASAVTPIYPTLLPTPAAVVSLSPLLRERRAAYTDNVLKVINSNPPLRQKYDHLVDLYHEQEAVRQRYVKVKADQPPVKPNLGPRVL